jgi:hypothetical protein
VTVNVGNKSFGYVFGARILDGEAVGLNKGLLGVGSQQAKGTYDNIRIQVAPPAITLDANEDYNDGVANLFTGATTGTWAIVPGAIAPDKDYVGTLGATGIATKDVDLGIGHGLDTASYLELTTTARTTLLGTAGIVFDQYASNDFKFVAIDLPTQRILVGHMDPRRGWVIETAVARALLANTDYSLSLSLKGASVAVSLNGSYVTTWGYNAAVVDGSFGLIARGAAGTFDNTRVRTNDRAFGTPGGALTAEGAGVASSGAPPLDEAGLVPVVADAERAWIASGADPSAFDGLRVAVADLSDGRLGQTVGKTIYIDATAAGYGWADVDLFEVIEHELGHVLGYAHEDAAEHPVMGASLSVTLASRGVPLAANSPAAASVLQQLTAPRAQPPLAALPAPLVSALVSRPTTLASAVADRATPRTRSLSTPKLLLRAIVPAAASVASLPELTGRVRGIDIYITE